MTMRMIVHLQVIWHVRRMSNNEQAVLPVSEFLFQLINLEISSAFFNPIQRAYCAIFGWHFSTTFCLVLQRFQF